MTGTQSRGDAVEHGIPHAHAFLLAEFVEVIHEHEAVEHGDAAQRDETDGGRDAEGHAAQAEGDDAAGEGERDAGGDEQGLPHAAKGEEDEHQDEHQRSSARRWRGGRGLLAGFQRCRRTRSRSLRGI
jgi:hypothetical protein